VSVARPAHLINLGVVDYREALTLQRSFAEAVGSGEIPDTVLFLEHPPTVTLGRRTEEGEVHIPETWSGDRFLFRAVRAPTQVSWMFSLRDKQAVRFASVPPSIVTPNAAFSPDGRWVAYASDYAGGQAVFVEPFPPTGSKYQIGEGNNPFWAPNGEELFFSIGGGPLFITSVSTQAAFTFSSPMAVPRPEVILRPTDRGRNYDIGPDGRRVLILVDSEASQFGSIAPRIQVVFNWFEDLKRLVPTN
jgi:hypothetical protein